MKKIEKIIFLATVFLSQCLFHSCDYLDVVPDDVRTLDHAFSNQLEAEKFLFTCFSYVPFIMADYNPGLCGSDELWTNRYRENNGLRVARGEQNINDPFFNYWEGRRGGFNLYAGIRDCNMFLEVLQDESRIMDLPLSVRRRWTCEVNFLKAYYHFCLFRMYGPIVIADVDIPIGATPDEVRVKRMPVDSVVNYIANLYDKALGDKNRQDLPLEITNRQTELGRITQSIVLSMKARLLVTAASPLFNGNPDYKDFKDNDGVQLFSQTYDPRKWELARDACETALKSCEELGIKPYEFYSSKNLQPQTLLDVTIRNSFSDDLWSSETIWGMIAQGRSGEQNLQRQSMADLNPLAKKSNSTAANELNPTIQITDFFYTDNGVPITEDKMWLSGMTKFDIRTTKSSERYRFAPGYGIAAMHFDREPRFYAYLGFDGCVWYMENSLNEQVWTLKYRKGQQQAKYDASCFSVTGYWPKKLVNWKYSITNNNDLRTSDYPWPEMRLPDLYLLYAEALCQTGNLDGAIEYVDRVRDRAGLKGVVKSWSEHSNQPDKYKTKEGLMEIIKQERTIELMFEGSRYWDVRRWKDLGKLNQTIQGWDIEQETAEDYYRPKSVYYQSFIIPRDYLSPLREYALIVNPNLVQNPGW